MKNTYKNILQHWNQRSRMARQAGSNDFVAKDIEIQAIGKYIKNGQRILEIGCGNGETALQFARKHKVKILGLDFSEGMIRSARKNATRSKLKGNVRFEVSDVRTLDLKDKYDIIFSERVLINLPDWQSQAQAIKTIVRHLRKGGKYLMCENSQEGLDAINIMRHACGLTKILPPWHNRYLKDIEISKLVIKGARIDKIEHYSSTYYFISRVVNAWLVNLKGCEPKYNAIVNKLALYLPPLGDFGQGRLWIWRKTN